MVQKDAINNLRQQFLLDYHLREQLPDAEASLHFVTFHTERCLLYAVNSHVPSHWTTLYEHFANAQSQKPHQRASLQTNSAVTSRLHYVTALK